MLLSPPQYRTLIVAGAGNVGRALLAVSGRDLDSFDEVVLVDREPRPLPVSPACRFVGGDIQEVDFLRRLLAGCRLPAIFVNLCAGVDNVAVRAVIAGEEVAYIDTSCCAPLGSSEVRFSRLMPYSLTVLNSRRPHLLCWGINPGLVEIVTRRLLAQSGRHGNRFDVTIYEHDDLQVLAKDFIAVGWNVDALVEEVIESPILVCRDGRLQEDAQAKHHPVLACWNGTVVPSRLVGHEDIWNLGQLPEIDGARFVYGLAPPVMAALEQDAATARRRLKVPAAAVPVRGLERVAVKVKADDGWSRTLLWQEDHYETWRSHGVNAVQYQTAKSVLLGILLLQHGRHGRGNGNHSGATLPLADADIRLVDGLMERLGISWTNGDTLDLRYQG
ncbi:MAG: hypothetical protein AB1568_00845 [Thermodesulfobacteriota bacterium]